MILLLDNFDSFTYNLNDYLLHSGAQVEILRNNVSLAEIREKKIDGIILSPGPGIPKESGNLMEVIESFHKEMPILGICLGHQALGLFFGAELTKARLPMHGKISEVNVSNDLLFSGLKQKIKVTRYHSLILENLTPSLEVIAETTEGEIMAIRHKQLPLRGIQFHPEAILTESGKEILTNWLTYYNLIK